MQAYVFAYIHMHTDTHAGIHIHIINAQAYRYTCRHKYMHTDIHMNTYIHAHHTDIQENGKMRAFRSISMFVFITAPSIKDRSINR